MRLLLSEARTMHALAPVIVHLAENAWSRIESKMQPAKGSTV